MSERLIHRVEVPAEFAATRVDAFLARRLTEYSRASLQRWAAEGRVRVNARPVRSKDKVRGGDIVEVEPGPPPLTAARPEPAVEFGVVYEDDALVVVDKPPGLVVHPGRGNYTGTLVNGLLARPGFEAPPVDTQDPEGHLRPGIVHRIDKGTSGLLVVAKNERAREGLKAQFSGRSVHRRYRAIALGRVADGTISTRYGRHPTQRLKFSSKLSGGKLAVTHVRALEQLLGATFIECRLETGRTHQIRVHLSEQAGAPLVGDSLYGRSCPEPRIERVQQKLGRQALHAAELGFEHPLHGKALLFESELPADIAESLSSLRQ